MAQARMTRVAEQVFLIGGLAAGLLLGGCRTPPVEPLLEEPLSLTAPGDQVKFVRDMMIEAAELSDGPSRSEKAVQTVRDWRGEGGAGSAD